MSPVEAFTHDFRTRSLPPYRAMLLRYFSSGNEGAFRRTGREGLRAIPTIVALKRRCDYAILSLLAPSKQSGYKKNAFESLLNPS